MSNDLVTPEYLSKELLHSIFDAAFMDVSLDSDGDLRITEQIKCCVLPSKDKDRIRLFCAFGFEEGVTQMQRLECVNKINAEYIMVRASSPNNDTLKIDYDIYIQGGISKKNSNYQHIPPKRHGLTLGLEAWMRSRSGRKKCGRREGLNNRPLTD